MSKIESKTPKIAICDDDPQQLERIKAAAEQSCSTSHDVIAHTAAQAFTDSRRSLARFSEELTALFPGQFLSPCKGSLVNRAVIVTIRRENILLKNSAKSLSRSAATKSCATAA